MNLKYRQAVESDLESLVDLWTEFDDFFLEMGSDYYKDYKSKSSEYREAIKKLNFSSIPSIWTIVCEDNEVIVGHISYMLRYMAELPPRFALYLSEVYVKDDYRSSGIGKRFFELIKAEAKTLEADCVYWNVWDRNTRARRFYERIGAEYLRDSDSDELFMKLKVE